LWIATERGLVRFDGLSFRLFDHSSNAAYPAGPIFGLAVDADGDLWVRPQGPKLLRYHDGTFQDVLSNLKLQETEVTAMSAGKNGDILFSGLVNGTVRYRDGKFTTLAAVAQLPNLVISVAESGDDKVWIGTKDAGLYYLSNEKVSAVSTGLPDKKINSLLAMDSRAVWIGTDNGVVQWDGTGLSPAAKLHSLDHTQGLVMIRDRDCNVWLGTSGGLMRIDARGISSLGQHEHPPLGPVTALFEDREGNLWVGTTQGIERLRDSVFATYSATGVLPAKFNGPVFVDSAGRTWVAPSEGGLYWLKEGQIGQVTNAGLDSDVIYSISGSKDGVWLGRRRGLTHLQHRGNSFTTQTYKRADGLAQDTVYAVYEDRDGTVWAGTLSGGLSRLNNGKFETYTIANGLGSNSVASLLESSDGTMWFGTPNGLNALRRTKWRTYTSGDGLPRGTVNCLLEDSTGALWIGTTNGLAFIRSGTAHTLQEVPESLREPIFGIEEDKNGSLWIATSNHILRADRTAMLRGVLSDGDIHEYSLEDGLASTKGVKRHRSVVGDSLGRIWFSTYRGLFFVDPTVMTFSSAPALVHVEEISADGKPIILGQGVRIPSPHQRITLRYTGLSLSVPTRVRFKFRLDGFDQGWSEPTATREAVYTNLDPGSYRFRVIASNSDGLWNSAESTFEFNIEPVFWQMWWFRLSILLSLAIAGLAFVRLRLLTITNRLNFRFEERLAERTRIAQELHDTLLQGFLSASMQLHVADDHLPHDSQAKPLVGRVLELMSHVIEEGRNAVRGLRLSSAGAEDLEQAFSGLRDELAIAQGTTFRVLVEGEARLLHPVIREEVYRIGREALVNAFRHSRANNIELELEYAPSYLRLLVRDNGSGIDPEVVRAGREGHWGLSGMRERAERISARFRVLSGASAGTEIELSVPGHIAFKFPSSGRSWVWIPRLPWRPKKTRVRRTSNLRSPREESPQAKGDQR
jgi:signal transduction histidine kinase/ligand-binding sensor domain-containing protein